MKKFKVVKLFLDDEFIGLKVCDIVELKYIDTDRLCLCELPKHLWGSGISNLMYKKRNYWWFLSSQLEEIKENEK